MTETAITHACAHTPRTHIEDGVVDFNTSSHYYQIILTLAKDGQGWKEKRGRQRQTSLFIWGIEGGVMMHDQAKAIMSSFLKGRRK